MLGKSGHCKFPGSSVNTTLMLHTQSQLPEPSKGKTAVNIGCPLRWGVSRQQGTSFSANAVTWGEHEARDVTTWPQICS